MSLGHLPSILVDVLFYVLLLGAAVSDLVRFRIPNAIVVALPILFIAAALLAPGKVAWLSHFGAGLLVLVVCAFMFHFNLMGGGDAKLLAALAVWTGFATLLEFIIVVSVLGGILALVLLAVRAICKRIPSVSWPRSMLPGHPLPYGVAIGGGAAVARALFPAF